MSMARRRLKSPQSLSGTSAHLTMVTLVNIMVTTEWLTSFSFHVNRPFYSWDKAISDSDLEISTPRSRSWVWSKGKVIQSAQYHFNSLHFHFASIRPTIPEIELFQNLTLKHPRSRSWVRSKVIYCTQYPTNALPFCFTSIGPTIPEIWPKECLTLKKQIRNFKRIFAKVTVSNRTSPKYNLVITMIGTIKLPCFAVIPWVVLTLSRRQANFC